MDKKQNDDCKTQSGTTSLDEILLSLACFVIITIGLIWLVIWQKFSWSEPWYGASSLSNVWELTNVLALPPLADVIGLIVATLAYVEAKISTGRIIHLLRAHR